MKVFSRVLPIAVLLLSMIFSLLPVGMGVFAAEEKVCSVITDKCVITLNGDKINKKLTDDNESTYISYEKAEVCIFSPEPIGGVYIKFDRTPPEWKLNYGEKTENCGKYGFLHEYQKINDEDVGELMLVFEDHDKPVSFADIFVLSEGESLPDFVQVWRPAEGQADIMLLIAHSDDDQLFFAGSVPDAVSRGAEMQVCYFTNHWNTHTRPHELLNGLWTCGLDRYPVVGPFPDKERVDSEEGELAVFTALGYSYEDMVNEQVRLLRKYKPQIVLAHDVDGEYGHGAHRLDSHSLRDALPLASDASYLPELAAKYGVWDVPKTYIHLWKENTIDFEIDVPLEYFGGRTAYQVSQDAFRCHISQFKSRYREWLLGTDEKPITKASDFPKYSPRYYGLYRSNVGEDVIKTDFYEHITLLKDQPSRPETPSEAETEHTGSASHEDPPDYRDPFKLTFTIVLIACCVCLIVFPMIWQIKVKKSK